MSIFTKSILFSVVFINSFMGAQSRRQKNIDPLGYPEINKKQSENKEVINGVFPAQQILITHPDKLENISGPVFIVNGERIENFNAVNSAKIKSITVFKGREAIDLYGEKAKNGVIVIQAEEDYLLKAVKKTEQEDQIIAI